MEQDRVFSGSRMVHASLTDPDVDVMYRAIDVLHVQLVARERESHMHWYWTGHDQTLTATGWETRADAITYMREVLERLAASRE